MTDHTPLTGKHIAELIEDTSGMRADPTVTEEMLASIAISMKRIADALNTPNMYGEVGSEALANSILRGLRGQ